MALRENTSSGLRSTDEDRVGPERPLSWRSVYALAALQLVVTLGWMAYANFQGPLVERFGFSGLSGALSLYLGLAGATLAPLTGGLGDRLAVRGGSRVPLIVTGGMLAGATFVGVAASLSWADPSGPFRWVFLALVLVWIAAMTVLQAPALSLLPAVATSRRWPVAASPLVVATVLPTALWPLVRGALDGLGGVAVYCAGGVLVVAATLLLRGAFEAAPRASEGSSVRRSERSPLALFALVFAVGVVSAFVTRLASDVVPSILATRVARGDPNPALFSATTLGVGTLLAPTLGAVGASLGSRSGALGSVALALACGVAAPLATSFVSAGAIAVLLGAALALHLDCALPFSLESLPANRAGLSAGLYLGGVFAGSQLAPIVPWLGALS
jgi:hypothetical protein